MSLQGFSKLVLLCLSLSSCDALCQDCYIARLQEFDNLLIKDFEIWTRNATNLGVCFRLCYTDPACISFQHNLNTGMCRALASRFTTAVTTVVTTSATGMRLYLPCTAANRYGASCTSGTDCHVTNTDCIDGSCQCQLGSYLSQTSYHCIKTFDYMGCYEDRSDRMLPFGHFSNASMTAEFCHQYCTANGHIYAATQHFQWCFCGDVLPVGYPKKDDSECNQPCYGDSRQMCGGSWRNSVYLHVA